LKALFVYKSWKVLENIWLVSGASPVQNSKDTFFNDKHKKIRYMKELILIPGLGGASAHFLQSFKNAFSAEI